MRRVILLGASNLTLGLPLGLASLRATLGAPLELLAAHGHGRSFGMSSRVLFRRLPGIRACGLWDDLAQRLPPEHPPLALVTDVGNDLLYGASIDAILAWVATSLERLRAQRAEIVVATLPVASILDLGRLRYRITKSLLFPGKGPDWPAMRTMVPELDTRLQALARSFEAAVLVPHRTWYGIDPIHVRRGQRPEMWREIIAAWPSIAAPRRAPTDPHQALRLWLAPPAERSLFDRPRRAPQPALRLEDGSTISLY